MAVAVNTTGTVLEQSGVGSASYTGLTIPGGLTNSALFLWIVATIGDGFYNALTWSGSTLTKVSTGIAIAGGTATQWALINPATGNQTISLTWTGGGSHDIIMCASVLTGVDQTNVATAFTNGTTGSATSTNSTLTVTTGSTNNLALTVFANNGSPDYSGAFGTGTKVWASNVTSINCAGGRNTGAATATVTASNSSVAWVATGINAVAAAAGGSSCRKTLSMLGVGCGIWAAKKIEENGIITRRRLLLPRGIKT